MKFSLNYQNQRVCEEHWEKPREEATFEAEKQNVEDFTKRLAVDLTCKEEKDLLDLETLGSSDKESLWGNIFAEEGGEKNSHHVKAGKGKDGRNRKKREGANQQMAVMIMLILVVARVIMMLLMMKNKRYVILGSKKVTKTLQQLEILKNMFELR